MLVNVHDDDSRITGRSGGGTIPKSRFERIKFQPLEKPEDRRSLVAEESEIVDRETSERKSETDQKRDAVAPPGLEEFVEAEAAKPPFGRGSGHADSRRLLKKSPRM